MSVFNEATVEDAALDYLRELGYATAFGPNLAADGNAPERAIFEQVYLYDRLRDAARRINPDHADLVDEAVKRLERAESQSEIAENFRVHKLLIHGVPVEYRDASGAVRTVQRQADRLRRSRQQRLAGGQPVHDHREARTAGPTCWCSSTASRSGCWS